VGGSVSRHVEDRRDRGGGLERERHMTSARQAIATDAAPVTAARLRGLLARVRDDEEALTDTLSLTANENLPSRVCRSMLTSPLADRYHLGAPFDRLPSRLLIKGGLMLKGLPGVYALEQAAHRAASDMFGAQLSDLRPLSGLHTTLCSLALTTRPGDTVYSVAPADGGHFATRTILERLGRKSLFLPWDRKRLAWNEDALRADFKAAPPSALFIDSGTVVAPVPVAPLRKAAGLKPRMLFDASHSLGLIAGGVFPNPLEEGCDVLQGNTHKTFPGPQKGTLHFRQWKFGETVCAALSKGFVSSQHTHHALALYVAMLEMHAFGRAYARQAVANAVSLGTALEQRGFELFRAGGAPTESNVLLVRRTGAKNAYDACETLLACGVMTNARPLYGCAVLRLGTQELTRRGMREPAMQWIADLVHRALIRRTSTIRLRREVDAFSREYPNVHYSFDRPLGWWR
jgi:glycine/serine hydroxymethyltransferase